MQAHLVAAGKYHDIDFARLELLKLLPQNGHPKRVARRSMCFEYTSQRLI